MIPRRGEWILPAALSLLLVACDPGPDAPGHGVSANASAPSPPETSNQSNGGESIIREDVLEETETPAPPEIEPVELTLDFADAGGELRQAAASKLDALLKAPVVAQGGCIVIRGHTDSRGSDEQNLRMSERRAAMVGDYLVEQGVARERLWLIGLGERRPIAPNAHPDGSDYPEGRAKNRRVTIEAQLPKGEAADPCAAAGRTSSSAELGRLAG